MPSDFIKRDETRIFHVEDSSAILQVAYNINVQQLAIIFNDGETVVYDNVPLAVYKEMLVAKSVGQYYNDNVRETFETIEYE